MHMHKIRIRIALAGRERGEEVENADAGRYRTRGIPQTVFAH